MRSETFGEEFARLVREYRSGDGQVAAEAWNLIADFAVENADAIGAALLADVVPATTATVVVQITDDMVRNALSAEATGSFYSDFARMRAALMASICATSSHAQMPSNEAAVKVLEDLQAAEHAKLGQMLLDKSEDGQSQANWQGGRVNGIGAALSAICAQVQDMEESRPLELNITKEWFERRAALEGDHEIGAGFRKLTAPIDPTSAPVAEQIDAIRAWSEQKYGEPFSVSACHDLLGALKVAGPAKATPAGIVKELHQQRRMIVSHATMGRTDGEGQTVDDICLTITKLRNELYREAQRAADDAPMTDALREAISKLLDQAEHVCIGAHTPLDIRGAAKNLSEPIKNLHAVLSSA